MEMENILDNLPDLTNPQALGSDPQQFHDLSALLNQTTSTSRMDRLISFLLPEDPNLGILAYLKNWQGDKSDRGKGKVEVLRILQWFLRNFKLRRLVWPACVQIKAICDDLWKSHKESAPVKQDALECIILILKNFKFDILQTKNTVLEDEEDATNFDLANTYTRMLSLSDKSSSGTPSVREKMFHCLGILAGCLRDEVIFRSNSGALYQLLNTLCNLVNSQVESDNKHFQANLLNGGIRGLDEFLSAFKDKLDWDNESLAKFLKNVEIIINPEISISHTDDRTIKLKRREFQRSGLNFIGRHGEMVADMLFVKHAQWFKDLMTWVKSNNAEDSRAGQHAMNKFLEVTCNRCREFSANNQDPEGVRKFLQFFTRELGNLASSGDSVKSETAIALKGLGLLCATTTDPKGRRAVLSAVMTKLRDIVAELNLPGVDKYSGSHFLMPAILEAISEVTKHLTPQEWNDMLNNDCPRLESLCVLLITFYPDLSEKYKRMAPESFAKLLSSLHSNPVTKGYWLEFLGSVFRESLNLIIASPTEAEAAILVEAYYREHQFEVRASENPRFAGGSAMRTVYNKLGIKTVKFYQDFFQWLMRSASFKDPSVKQTVYNTIIEWGLTSIGRLDLTIEFVQDDDDTVDENLVDPSLNTKAKVVKDFQLLLNTVEFFGSFIQKSQADYFREWIVPWLEKMYSYSKANPLVSGFYRLISFAFTATRKLKFFKKVEPPFFRASHDFLLSTVNKLGEFRDDLLVSVLDVWLSAPSELIIECQDHLTYMLQKAFNSGKNYYPIAERSIQAVNRWFEIDEFSDVQKRGIMNKLFPVWKEYLVSDKQEQEVLPMETTKATPKYNKRANVYQQRQLEVISAELDAPSLQSVSRGLIRLLGNYGHIIEIQESTDDVGFLIGGRIMKYAIPLVGVNAELYIDYLLPKISELCKTSIDRKQRALAGETYHSFVQYLLGVMAASRDNNSMLSLYRQLFSNVMDLGCDDDSVIRQIFNPLVLQIVHWSSKLQTLSDLTLQIILDGLVQTDVQSKRDFCGTCLEELIYWSMKENSTRSIDSIIRSLIALAQHSSPMYRLGAGLGFNRVYRHSRNNAEMAIKFALELIHSFIMGLSLCTENDVGSTLLQLTKRAIGNLERAIIRLQSHFNNAKANPKPRVPKDMNGPLLVNLLDWLLWKSATVNAICRHECFRLIGSLAPHAEGVASVQKLLEHYNKRHEDKVTVLDTVELAIRDTSEKKLTLTNELLIKLEKTSAMYMFLAKPMRESDRLRNMIVDGTSSRIGPLIKLMLKNYPTELENLSDVLCLSVIRNLSLTDIVEPKQLADLEVLSFDISARLELEDLRKTNIDKAWKESSTVRAVERKAGKYFEKKIEDLIIQIGSEEDGDSVTVQQLRWFAYCFEAGAVDSSVTDEVDLFSKLWDFVDAKLFRETDGVLQEYAMPMRDKNLVDAAFQLLSKLPAGRDELVSRLLDRTLIRRQHQTSLQVIKGEIYQQHSLLYFAANKEIYQFETYITKYSMESIAGMIRRLLVLVKTQRHLRKVVGKHIVEQIILIWERMLPQVPRNLVSGMISGMASLHKDVCQKSKELSDWWCGPYMMSDANLTFIDKAEFVHFFGLFGSSTDKQIRDKAANAIKKYIYKECNEVLKWDDTENHILKILYTLLTVFTNVSDVETLQTTLQAIAILVHRSLQLTEGKPNTCCLRARSKILGRLDNLQVEVQKQADLVIDLYRCIIDNSNALGESLGATYYTLLPCLAATKEYPLKTFFKSQIGELMKLTGTSPETKEQWIQKITSFTLLETLCLLTTTDKKPYITSEEFLKAYHLQIGTPDKKDDKSFSKDLVKACSAYNNPADVMNQALRRFAFECNQSAFNAMSTALRMIGSKAKPVNGFVIKERVSGDNSAGWSNLVDETEDYVFPDVVELDARASLEDVEDNDTKDPGSRASASFALSNALQRKQNLVGSSLAIEATDYDFTAAATVSNMKYYERIFGSGKKSDTDVALRRRATQALLSSKSIKDHRCLGSFVETIRYLVKTEDGPAELLPSLRALLGHKNKNVKLFTLAGIVESKDVLKQYATELTDSIIRALVVQQSSDETVTEMTFNMFIKDVLIMLFEWSEVTKPKPEIIMKCIVFVLSIIHNDRKDIFTQNLDFLSTIVEKWVTSQDQVPVNSIGNLFTKYENKNIGLEVCRTFLLQSWLPCHPEQDNKRFNKDALSLYVTGTFKGTSKITRLLAAEVGGLLLKNLPKGVSDAAKKISTCVQRDRMAEEDVLIVARSIGKHYPPFAVEFKDRALEVLRSYEMRPESLSLLSIVAANTTEGLKEDNERLRSWTLNLYQDMANRGVFDEPCRTLQELLPAMKLVEHFLKHLPADIRNEQVILRLVEWVESSETSPSTVLKEQFASCVSNLYFEFQSKENEDAVLILKAEKLFLRLLDDSEENIKNLVEDFWSKTFDKWPDVPSLLIRLFELLKNESNAIILLIELLLRKSRSHPDYEKVVFNPDSIGVTAFMDYQIDTSWRMRHASFQPLFAESFSSQQNFSQLPRALQMSVMSLRQGAGGVSLNLLSSFRNSSSLMSQGTAGTVTSQIGASFTGQNFYSSFDREFEGGYSLNSSAEPMEVDPVADPLQKLRKRFQPRISAENFAIRAHERQEGVIEATLNSMRSKRDQIHLTKKYRIGELPDISMTHADLMRTFKQMSKVEPELGRIFLTHLLSGILQDYYNMSPRDGRYQGRAKFMEKINSICTSVLASDSPMLDLQFAGVIVDLSVKNPHVIKLRPELVANTCEGFEMHRVGVLALENSWRQLTLEEEPQTKRSKTEGLVDIVEESLMMVARLYRGMDDSDSLRLLFGKAAEISEANADIFQEARRALGYEDEGDFENAYVAYKGLYAEEQNRDAEYRAEMWNASAFKCCQQISKWDEAFDRASEIVNSLGGLTSAWTNLNYAGETIKEHLLAASQWLVRKRISATEESENDDKEDQILAFLQGLRQTPGVEVHEFVEPALLAVYFDEDVGKTLAQVDKAVAKASSDFRLINKMSTLRKKDILLRLQRLEYLYSYLELCLKNETDTSDNSGVARFQEIVRDIARKWKNIGYPSSTSYSHADIVVAERNYYVQSLSNIVSMLKTVDSDVIMRTFLEVNIKQYLWLMDLGIRATNSQIATNAYSDLKGLIKKDAQFLPLVRILNCEYLLAFQDFDQWYKGWATAWARSEKLEDIPKRAFGRTQLLLGLTKKVKESEERDSQRVVRGVLFRALEVDRSEDLMAVITAKANTIAKELHTSEELKFENSGDASKLYWSLYKLLAQFLSEDEDSSSNKDLHETEKHLMYCMMQAMKYGNDEAVLYFPTLLPILETNHKLCKEFDSLIKETPKWMMLPWLDQIVAAYNHTKVHSVKTSLEKLILMVYDEYPGAFQLEHSKLPVIVGRISPVHVNFREALHAVVIPAVKWKSYMDALDAVFKSKNISFIIDRAQQFKLQLSLVGSKNEIYGHMHQEFADKFSKSLAVFMEQMHNLSKEQQPVEVDEEVFTQLQKDFEFHANSNKLAALNLKDLSPWLSSFQASDYSEVLEIPGLYQQFRKPSVEYHPKIVSFGQTVSVLPSITKPIRLELTCNTGQKMFFLVKKGDDLRQDKRIQQCFNVCNEIFQSDPTCRDRLLRVATYAVTPLSSDFGLIQWVDKTVSLKDMILTTNDLKTKNINAAIHYGADVQKSARKSGPLKDGITEVYLKHAHQITHSKDSADVVTKFSSMFKDSMFRNNLMEGCNTLEEFFTLRDRMIRSYATQCYVHWLLGIGDRHLENQLISFKTGEFLGIDFGKSFGLGILRQQIPELVPFRLTPQLIGLMDPYGAEGLFKETMLHVKRCMNKHGEILLTVVDIFIKEPNPEWFRSRARTESSGTTPSPEALQNKDVLERIGIVKKKLQGYNPAALILEDLARNPVPNAGNFYGKIVKSIHSVEQEKLSDEAYVDALIKLSSHKAALSSLYQGWSSWL